MATDVDCPSCDQKLRVPEDLLGKKVKCPSCKTMFRAAAGGLEEPVASPPVDEEEPRSSTLTTSRRDFEDGDDELPRRRRRGRKLRRKRFADYQPHRGTLILVLGIVGLVAIPICGVIAWVMGNNDLKEIRAGRMDPEGESQTNIGRILGMVATILMIVSLVVGCIFGIIWLIAVLSIVGAAAGAHGH